MISIGMSTSCVYPLGMEQAFRLARLAGYDGVEVMITNDPTTQDADALLRLSERYSMPILSVHAPVLLLTTFVYGRDPRVKLERSAEHAARLGAGSVVVHPPFRWQSGYADEFERIVRETAQANGVDICVENMFPWKVGGRGIKAYKPSSYPLDMDVDAMTLDCSSTCTCATAPAPPTRARSSTSTFRPGAARSRWPRRSPGWPRTTGRATSSPR
jgi:hypothetical protein